MDLTGGSMVNQILCAGGAFYHVWRELGGELSFSILVDVGYQ